MNTQENTPADDSSAMRGADRLLTQEEAQAMLGLAPATFRRLAKAGNVPRVPVGARLVRYRLSDIQRIVREGLRI
jgi:predicted DNA-binding transcriptional regulator AlpA